MNTTTNYQLNQWDASDRVQRVDFNADNAKIEAALSGLEARVALLDRAVPNLAYYATQYALFDYKSTGKSMPGRGVLFDNFQYTDSYSVSGGTSVKNGILTTAAQSSGKMQTGNIATNCTGWTRAMLWLHSNASGVTPKVEGITMKPSGITSTFAPGRDNISCEERVFTVDGLNGSHSAVVTLEINNSGKSPLEVYDYTVFLF
ncbi:hypothetical protein D1641_18210 [Colidextribacter sp. OB.20]|uniref:hypothetical protein n=1 Tax=Colidextribacter sp. OB.20 TaxID=2304568 RepID=UPI00136D02AD|nr:hypothetical protein [Colidextribacter sp. OB.20]NBI11902.1 hypothetical protein [Colidextribacter sp. OB.20]